MRHAIDLNYCTRCRMTTKHAAGLAGVSCTRCGVDKNIVTAIALRTPCSGKTEVHLPLPTIADLIGNPYQG